MCTPSISSLITKLDVIKKPQFCGLNFLVFFFILHNHLCGAITRFSLRAEGYPW